MAVQLAADHARLQDATLEAQRRNQTSMEAVRQIEKRLDSLPAIHEQVRGTEEQLASLSALAEHVSHKVKALEGQKRMVERAVVEANRLNEMVWAMDMQIQKLNEGNAQMVSAEQVLARIEKVAQETAAQLESATTSKDAFGAEVARLDQRASAAADAVRVHLERWSIEKKEVDAFDARLGALQGAMSRAEERMASVETHTDAVAELSQRATANAKQFHELAAQTDELLHKQEDLDVLRQRLTQAEALAARTTSQIAGLDSKWKDLDARRKEISDC